MSYLRTFIIYVRESNEDVGLINMGASCQSRIIDTSTRTVSLSTITY